MHPDDKIRAIVIVTNRIALDRLFIVFSSYWKIVMADN